MLELFKVIAECIYVIQLFLKILLEFVDFTAVDDPKNFYGKKLVLYNDTELPLSIEN